MFETRDSRDSARRSGRFTRFNPAASSKAGQGATPFAPSQLPNLLAWYRYGMGITVSTGVSQWNDASGNGYNLLQGTGADQPALQSDGSILFNGTSHFLAATFTANQPVTQYIMVKQVTWTASTNKITDGVAATGGINQITSTPSIGMNAGSALGTDSNLAVGKWGVVSVVMNGASSSIKVNSNAATSGAGGSNNPGGLTVGAVSGGASLWTNIQVKEIIMYSVAHTSDQQNMLINYLSTYGLG